MNKFDKVLTPFFDLFAYVAGRMYAGSESAQLAKMRQDKPYFFAAALIGDSIVRLFLVGSALMLAVAIALKLVG